MALTARMHANTTPTAGASLLLNASAAGANMFWRAIDMAHAQLGPIVDSDTYHSTVLTRAGAAMTVTAPGQMPTSARHHLQPLVAHPTATASRIPSTPRSTPATMRTLAPTMPPFLTRTRPATS